LDLKERKRLEALMKSLLVARNQAVEYGFTLLASDLDSLLSKAQEILKEIVWREYKYSKPELFELEE